MSFAKKAALVAAGVCGWALAAACLPGTGPALLPDDAGEGSLGFGDDASRLRTDANLGDPFAIEGLSPSHGPFTGGTRTRIDGRGFSTKLKVFVGGVEVAAGAFLASDPTRAAIVMPPGAPGFVDVRIRDDLTVSERTLVDGYYYDPFVVAPDTGATSGGTRVVITGSGTSWAEGTTVTIGGIACSEPAVVSLTRIECASPVGTPGSKDVVVSSPVTGPVQARDAFTYSDSVDGYRGGLSGGALAGRVKVLAFDAFLGKPVAGAFAIAGGDLATAKVARTTANGVVEIPGIAGDKVTVTVAAKCFSPITFIDVPVDTVTVYLSPVLDPACIDGDPPSTIPGGGGGRFGGVIEGQLVFPGAREFERAVWTTVPSPTKPTERRAAYVFEVARSPDSPFRLPSPSAAITPETPGTNGFNYALVVYPGNVTIYVVAGIEDRSAEPPSFIPYAMGVGRGIGVPAQGRVQGVDIQMDVFFDHQVTVSARPPLPASRGPDRFTASVAATLGPSGYALLPRGTRTSALPAPDEIPFVGVPSLDKAMSGEQYILGGVAATGAEQRLPASVVSRVRTTNANTPVSLGGFLGVPVLVEPSAGVWAGRRIAFTGATGPVDLSVTSVSSGGGLVVWTIAAPGGVTSFDLPDLSALPGADPLGLRAGTIETTVYTARIEAFDYGRLRNGQLAPGPWSAYAASRASGVY